MNTIGEENGVIGMLKFFNNLIVKVEDGGIKSVEDYIIQYVIEDEEEYGKLPYPTFFYNTIIVQSGLSCASVVGCYGSSTANLYYQFNYQTNLNCEGKWKTHFLTTCNYSSSSSAFNILNDTGGHNNIVGSISFNRSGEIPYPYYSLGSEDVIGMDFEIPRNTSCVYPWTLPNHDYIGNSRLETPTRISAGPFEYACPSQCLLGGQRVDCQISEDCGCFDGYFGRSCEYEYDPLKCPDCSFRGNCTPDEISGRYNCSCENVYYGDNCEFSKTCFGKSVDDVDDPPCDSNGRCVDFDLCKCFANYYGTICNITSCYGEFSNNTERVCHGHGNCTSSEICSCESPHYNNSEDCGEWFCFGVSNSEDEVCSGHGKCTDYNHCECNSQEYTGDRCNTFTCFNISSDDKETVCNYGTCVAYDQCECFSGYHFSEPKSPCDEWKCYGTDKSTEMYACSGRGQCTGPDRCECSDDFEGLNCDTWSCGFDYKIPSTCSGNGKCVSPSNCDCEWGRSGKYCERNDLLVYLMTPVLSTAGVVGILFLLIIGVCVVCCLCFCFVLLLVSVVGASVLFLRNRIQKVRLSRFSKLKNINLLLKEQELDEDVSIAHLRIEKALFEIKFDEIELVTILGQGGSNSVVYKSKWNNQIVAFKCFKTSSVCQSQDSFDEFEREVAILGSVSHPHILQFYGCCLQPPRVGILMEYCSQGDLEVFLSRHQILHEDRLEITEKMRILSEIIQAMIYLHSRKIVHRDLKLENVLVDASNSCKLMDFGLSRIVDRMSQIKTKKIGTSYYMAPELITGDGTYDEKVDVFAFGICIFIIITENRHPYGLTNVDGIEMRVALQPDLRPDINTSVLEENGVATEHLEWLEDTMKKCWHEKRNIRPSFAQLSKLFTENIENNTVASSLKTGEKKRKTKKLVNNKKNIEEEMITQVDEQEEKDDSFELMKNENEELKSRNQELEEELKKMKKRIEELERVESETETEEEESETEEEEESEETETGDSD